MMEVPINAKANSMIARSPFGKKLRFSPTCGGKGIKDFLIMPVQRIPRYSMLLQDMVKNTWPDHADYASLSAALKTILELASYVVSLHRPP